MMLDDSLPAIIVNVSSLADEIDINNTAEVRKYLFNHFKGREIRIKSDGMLAFFGRNGLSDSLKRKNEHRKVLSALDKIIEYSYPVGFQKVDSRHSKKRPDLRGQFIYGALISLTSKEQPEQILALAIKLDDSAADKGHLYFKDVSLIKMRPLYAGQTEKPNVNLPADRTVFTIHDVIEIVKQKFKDNPLCSEKGNFISEKLEPSRVLQPSPAKDLNHLGDRTISNFLRYDTLKNDKVKSKLHKNFKFNWKGKIMQTTPEMYQLSPLELTLSIRAAEAQNSLEYMYLVCKSGTIRPENQLDAMHLTSLLKENPELLENAKTVLEVRRESEFQKFIGKTAEPAVKQAADQPEVKKEYKSSLLVALKYAVDMAVYRAKAAIMAINNAALKNSLSALEKVQVQVSQLEQLKDKELNLQQQISGNVPKQPKTSDEDLLSPKVAASESKPSDEDLLSPKVSTAIESVPAKKESPDSAKMKI